MTDITTPERPLAYLVVRQTPARAVIDYLSSWDPIYGATWTGSREDARRYWTLRSVIEARDTARTIQMWMHRLSKGWLSDGSNITVIALRVPHPRWAAALTVDEAGNVMEEAP